MAVVSRIVVRNSDISGAEGAESVKLDGYTFKVPALTLDLLTAEADDYTDRLREFSDAVADLYAETFAPELAAVARLAAAGANTSGGAASKSAGTPAESPVRAWARLNGFTVGERGRIGADVKAAYGKAMREAGNVTDLDAEQDGPTDAELDALASETV